MNPNYATLNSYNDVISSDISVGQYTGSPAPSSKSKESSKSNESNISAPTAPSSSIIPALNNKIYVMEAVLEGYNMVPEILTNASAVLTLIYDPAKQGFHMSLKLKKVKNMVACEIFTLNQFDSKEKFLMTLWENKSIANTVLMNVILDFIPFKPKEMGVSWSTLLSLIVQQKIVVSISTEKYPEGEIDGVLSILY
jgi:hypothetical protein